MSEAERIGNVRERIYAAENPSKGTDNRIREVKRLVLLLVYNTH